MIARYVTSPERLVDQSCRARLVSALRVFSEAEAEASWHDLMRAVEARPIAEEAWVRAISALVSEGVVVSHRMGGQGDVLYRLADRPVAVSVDDASALGLHAGRVEVGSGYRRGRPLRRRADGRFWASMIAFGSVVGFGALVWVMGGGW
ncbi:MAG: hypothetical protein AAF593_01260 [Planctomycetota bacterium]